MTGPSSERTADADAATVREECAKLIGAKVEPLLESGRLGPMWPWWLPLVDAISDRLVARNQQLEEELAAVPEIRAAELGWDGTTTALERIEERNQQLQEALEFWVERAEYFQERLPSNLKWLAARGVLADAYATGRAALASAGEQA